ncbi:hypothetical protein BG452_07705 [Streptomyces sp. CBMA123]|nr:hypothetical protein [Streptomyces sp. CBMA123]
MRTAAIPCTCRAAEAGPSTAPTRSHSLDELAEFLTLLREEAGSPSFSTIVRRISSARAARGVPAEERTPGRITVYDCFRSGRRRLDVELLADIVQALGADPGPWRDAYRTAAGSPPFRPAFRQPDPTPGPHPAG